jgi:hypothetical protein
MLTKFFRNGGCDKLKCTRNVSFAVIINKESITNRAGKEVYVQTGPMVAYT